MSKKKRIWNYGRTYRSWEAYKFKQNFSEQAGFSYKRVKQEEAIDMASSKEKPKKPKTILRKKRGMKGNSP